MPDDRDANCLLVGCELVDDAIGADSQRAEAAEPATQCVPGVGVALEQTESVLDSVDPPNASRWAI